jgi:hypothetical protein
VGRLGIALVVGLALPQLARADDDAAKRWPSIPVDHSLSESDRMIDNLSEIGNRLGRHMDTLSHDLFTFKVDGRGQRARLRVGGGNAHYLEFRIDSDWLFSDGKARINAKVQLGIAGHEVDLKLPTMDLSQDSYHGEQLVQVNVPLLERRF